MPCFQRFSGSGWGPGLCAYKRLPGDANADGLRTADALRTADLGQWAGLGSGRTSCGAGLSLSSLGETCLT